MRKKTVGTLPDAMSVFFIMLGVYCIDIFIFMSDVTVLGDALFSRVLSIIILFIFLRAAKESVRALGFSKRGEKILAGGLYGTFFSLVPVLVTLACEFVLLTANGSSEISSRFATPNLAYIENSQDFTPTVGVAIFVFTCFIGCVFKEAFFRGFMLKKFKKLTSFAGANTIQSLLYASFALPLIARNILRVRYDENAVRVTALFVVFYILHEILAGFKWGLVTRVSGSTYIAIADHFIFDFLSNSILLAESYEQWEITLRMLAMQVVSFLLVLVYYIIGMKKINKKHKIKKAKEEAELNEIKERKKQREERLAVKKNLGGLSEISPANFKSLSDEERKQKKSENDDEGALNNKIILEEALKEDISHTDDKAVDEILRKASKEMKRKESTKKSDEIDDDFDSDDFLKEYQNRETSHKKTHTYHHHHSQHHSHHHNEDKEETAILPQKEKPIAKKPKKTFAQKLQSLGGIDDSSSNDLI